MIKKSLVKKFKYNNGKYVGSSVDALYGNVKVQIIIKQGKLKEIEVIDYPKEDFYSEEVNGRALPVLKKEAILKQTSNIDTVSGATETSEGFIKSLKSALFKASKI